MFYQSKLDLDHKKTPELSLIDVKELQCGNQRLTEENEKLTQEIEELKQEIEELKCEKEELL